MKAFLNLAAFAVASLQLMFLYSKIGALETRISALEANARTNTAPPATTTTTTTTDDFPSRPPHFDRPAYLSVKSPANIIPVEVKKELVRCVHPILIVQPQEHISTLKHTQTHTQAHTQAHTSTHEHTQAHARSPKHTQETRTIRWRGGP